MPKEKYSGDGWEQVTLGLFAESNSQINKTRYLKINNVNDDSSCRWLAYLDFKYWLYENFQEFEDKEIETDVWKIERKNKELQVKLAWRIDEEIRKQYVSVGFFKKYDDYYGWACPCDTLAEVREKITQGLKDLNER